MDQSRSGSQEILHLLRQTEVPCLVQKDSPPVSTLRQTKVVNALPKYLYVIHINITLQSKSSVFQVVFLLQAFPPSQIC
jgi:hypothetical protein